MNINFYYKYKVMSDSPKSDNLNLQLGDIISIDAPTNEELNEKLFYINYIDKDKIKLVDSDNNQTILTINSDFFFLILSPLLIINSRLYSEILRIKSDLSGFQKSNDYLKIAPKKFNDFI